MWTLDERDRTEIQPTTGEDPEGGTKIQPALACRACGQKISEPAAIFRKGTTANAQAFPNPAGQLKVIFTVRYAESIQGVSAPTTDFTWFAGYAWTILTCANCKTHVGWQYDAVNGDTPPRFFGLLRTAIAETGR